MPTTMATAARMPRTLQPPMLMVMSTLSCGDRRVRGLRPDPARDLVHRMGDRGPCENAPASTKEDGTVADRAEIGIFGGSGFYSLLDDVREVKVDTPYGPPSDSFFLATVAGRAGRVPAAPRAPPHDPAAQGQLPGQRVGDALAGREGRDQPVRRGLAPAPRGARPLRGQRPVRGPDERPRRHLLRRADRVPRLVGRDLRPGPARGSRSRSSASTASPSTTAARSSSSRARGSRRRPSRSGSATPGGRSST